MSAAERPAIFLDRDGLINALAPDPTTGVPESPYRPEHVELLPGVAAAIERLASAKWVLIVASNQPGAAKGITTEDELDAVHERVVELLGPAASAVLEWRYCRHHPEARDPALRECGCRKPAPGLLLDAAAEHGLDLARSWMVGDADRDIAAGAAAGTRTILVEHAPSAHRRTGSVEPDLVVADLGGAADAILG